MNRPYTGVSVPAASTGEPAPPATAELRACPGCGHAFVTCTPRLCPACGHAVMTQAEYDERENVPLAATAAPLRIERLVGELAAGDIDVDTFMERLDALVASPPLDTEKIARARRRWRAIL